MKKGFTTFLSALKANTPPVKKGHSSLRFLSLFLILFLAVGNAWAADETYEIANPTASVFGYSNGVVNVYGDVQTSKKINNKSQTVFVSSSDYPVIITSNCANIKGISFNVCCSSSGNGTDNSIKIQTQQGNTLADVPANTFIATKDGSSLTSLCPIAVTKDQTKQTSISITFNTKQSIVAIVRNSNQGWIKDLVVTYDDAVAPPSQFVVAKTTSTANIYTLTPSKGTMSGSTTTDKKTYNSTDFYKLNSTNAFTMPTANKFKVGDVVVFEIAPSQAKKSIGIKIGSTTLVVNKAQAVGIKLPYIITAESDELKFERNSSDTYLSSVTIYHTEVIPTGHHVTYDLNGGTGTTPTQADVAEGAKFTLHDGTTDITAPENKDFAGWNDGTTTYDGGAEYTMGTSDVELTAQWADVFAVTYAKGDEGASGEMTDSNSPYVAGAEVTLLANAFTPPTGKEFDAWEVTETESGDPVAVSENKFTMPAAAVTVKATWKDACALDPTVSATTLGTTSYTTQVVNCAGISVLGSAGCTISEYGFVYGTATAPTISDNKKALEGDYTVAGTAFAETTLSGLASNTTYYVRAFATNSHGIAYGDEISFTTLAPLGNVLVVANSASQTSDAITALSDNGFIVTVSAPNNSRDYTGYDLVVLDESLSGGNGVDGKEEGDIKDVNIPLLNLKSFFYNSGRWGWGTGNNGTADNEIAKIPATYKNAQSHPIFAGLTITDGNIDLIDPAKTGNTLQTATGLAAGKEGYVLATVGGNAFIHELTPAQRGVTDAKYLMVAISNNAKDNLSVDGELLIVNAAKYLLGSTAWVPQYYTVSFDPHGGDPIAPRTGNPEITLPETEYGTQSFLGWFTEEAGGTKIGEAGDFYTPTADITLHAQWEAVSTDARLASITFSSDAGTLSPAFDPEVTNYTYTMPYGTAVPTITGATKANAAAKDPVIDAQATAWGETAHVHGVAASDDTKDYYVQMLRAPKDGVSIIKVATTGGTNKTVTGLYAGEGDVNLSSSKKMDGGKYIGFTLDGTTLQAGDCINVHTTTASTTGGSHIIFYDNMTDKTELYDTGEIGGEGDNIFTINAAMVGQASAYVYRSSEDNAHKWNGYIDYIEVTRPMNPVLTAITFDGEAGVIDEDNKKVTVELPFSSDVASMVVEPTIAWNAPAASGAEVVTSNSGNWVIGVNTYRLTDKDGDQTTYTITLTQAAASADATLATLTYNGTNITLEADQYNYEVELPKGTVDVPTVTYTTNNAGATVVKTDAAVLPGATTIKVTAEDGTTQQNYTINFTVSTSDIITIFDGSTMSNIATSPSGAISWEIVGSTMGAGDKNASYNDVTYTRALSCGNSSATKHLKIVVADNNKAQFEIIGMSNSSSDTRHAWLTNSTDKGEYANAIAGLTSNGYNPAKFTTDWLEEGTYYLHSDNTVAILLIRVKAEPVPAKCEAPTISGLADVAVCDLSSALLDGTATVSDDGTVTYKWYAEGDAETVLATTATYAPTTVGNYYVVATNSLADHRDNSTTSSVVVVRIKTAPVITTEVLDKHAEAGNNVTLSVVATDAESYQWYTCDDAAGTNPVEVVGATNASLEVAVTSGMSQYYKVIISNTCGSAESIGKVEEWTELPQANVTGSRTWDWAAESMGTIETVSGSTEYLMANVSSQVPNTEAFRSDMLYITANYANRSESQQFFQGTKIRFNTTVDGLVRVYFRGTGNSEEIRLTINGEEASTHMGGFEWSNYIEVPAGEVTILGTNTADPAKLTRIQKIEFLALGYTRDVNVGELATVCLPNACVARDVEVYELVGKEPQYGKIVFDEILSGELMAGKPYLLRVTNPKAKFYYTVDAPAAEPNNSGAMKGTFENITLTNLTNIYYFAQKALWSCVDLTSLSVPANRAYLDMSIVPVADANPAPGRRRVTLGVNGQQVATGVDQVQGNEVPTKMIINGQLFILRGEKMYDAQGKLVR